MGLAACPLALSLSRREREFLSTLSELPTCVSPSPRRDLSERSDWAKVRPYPLGRIVHQPGVVGRSSRLARSLAAVLSPRLSIVGTPSPARRPPPRSATRPSGRCARECHRRNRRRGTRRPFP